MTDLEADAELLRAAVEDAVDRVADDIGADVSVSAKRFNGETVFITAQARRSE